MHNRYISFKTNKFKISMQKIQPSSPVMSPPDLLVRNPLENYKTSKLYSSYLPSQGFSIKYDPSNQYMAIGCNNGTKILQSVKDRKNLQEIKCEREDPITCVKWRPMVNTKSRVLGVANAGGFFEYYHVPSMKKLFTIEEKENSIHVCDFSKSGEHFATSGKDAHIRVYDQNTKSISIDLSCAEWNYRGHSNRVFAVKFIDDNTIISGGWDSVIHLWDLRQGKSVKSVFGPHVAGDSIDFADNEILIGCYASKKQIQIWDYNKFVQKQSITWTSAEDKEKVAYVYSCCFSNYEPKTILAGACSINEVKVFHQQNEKYAASTVISGLKHGCFSVDQSSKSSQFAFSTASEGFYVYQENKA